MLLFKKAFPHVLIYK